MRNDSVGLNGHIHAVYLDGPNRLRHNLMLSDWKIDAPVGTDFFTSAKAAGAKRMKFAHLMTWSSSAAWAYGHANAWGGSTAHTIDDGGTTAHVYGAGTVHTTPYGAAAYHPPGGYYGYHPPTTVNYYGAHCYDCGSGWATAGAAVAGAAVGAVAAASASSAAAVATTGAGRGRRSQSGRRDFRAGADRYDPACGLRDSRRARHGVLLVR
jgi:hypothetical protein